MPILSDCHLHSSHSGDSDTPMEDMILQGIEKGLTTMCFTEHNDFDFPVTDLDPEGKFELNTDAYLYDLIRLREKYADRIRILFGVELGLQPSCVRKNAVFAKSYDFDFIIGSSHLVRGKDPYYPAYYEGRDEKDAYREYFESILENIQKFSNFDVYGHLDYVVRYGPTRDEHYSYSLYREIIDEILKLLIEKEKGIEINTGGLKKGMRDVHPYTDIIKRYHELGGEIITIGSDAHTPDQIGYGFERVLDILKGCGFQYYTVFEKRLPEYKRIV